MPSPRQSVLADRHRALGSDLGEWNDMDVAWEYDQDVNLEHQAVRNAAGLFDVSGLKKVMVTGPDALAVCDHVCTRDLTKIYPGKSCYAIILNDEGRITDDCIMFHIAPNVWMMVHGGGTGMSQLQSSAEGKNVSIVFDDDLHNVSLQGQKALELLDAHTPFDLDSLAYFHHQATTLFGRSCMISRTGYSGERGYEIFARGEDVGAIWDATLEHGKPMGVIPCSFNCIDMIRVEAALLFYPYDMDESKTPWEVGLGFAISKKKAGDYRGREALLASQGKETIGVIGIVVDSDQAADADAEIFADGRKIGHVSAPMYSTVMGKSLAMVQVELAYTKPGMQVEVRSESGNNSATTSEIPFLDPNKNKRTA